MTEKIGNVVLDMTYYPGEDHYSDGDIEDELLQVAMEHEWRYHRCIGETCRQCDLY